MAAIILTKEQQARLGNRSNPARLLCFKLRKLAQEQERGKWEYFADDSATDPLNHNPQDFKKSMPIIEFSGSASARSGVFVRWLDAD